MVEAVTIHFEGDKKLRRGFMPSLNITWSVDVSEESVSS